MKKLSLKNLKLETNDMLQRNQLKTVFGGYAYPGGSCCVTVVGNVSTSRHCGFSKQEAIDEANTVASWGGVRAYWCCASC